jgi:hypothetical protein
MGRRKRIFYGQSLDNRFDIALGFPEYDRAKDVLSEYDFEVPNIDWSRIESLVGNEIPPYTKKEIDFEFEAELGFRVRKAITSTLSGELPEDEMSESDFLRKVERIENLARSLASEINELAELGTQLVVRPKPKDGLTSAEVPEEFYAQVTGKIFDTTDECFFDYYSFRKQLDYYSHFSDQNGGFQSRRGYRFDRRPDYSWYETFVRRVVLAFWPTNFPMTVTIPTDTNPDFSSPIILILGELREQFNQLALTTPGFADMYEEWTYRQHARRVLSLRDEFEKSEIFWALTTLRKFESEQSDLTDDEK